MTYYPAADLERLVWLRKQFQCAALVPDKLFHAMRVIIESGSEAKPCQGWEEFLADEQVFECESYERRYNGVQHSCYYGARRRLKEYTGLAAAGVEFLSLDLCPMLDSSYRNAYFDRDIWTLALYRISLREEFKVPIDLRGSGPYARAEPQRYRWLRSVVASQSTNAEREQLNLFKWRAEVAAKTGHTPRYVYASLGLDVFQTSVVAIDYLCRSAIPKPPRPLPKPYVAPTCSDKSLGAANISSSPGVLSESPSTNADVKPHWDRNRGHLYWGEEVVRRVLLRAKNVIKVLDAFQAKNWCDTIDDPLAVEIDRNGSPGPPRIPNPEQLHSTLKTLNRNLRRMRFHADGTGQRIRWTSL